jgi:hypothetical protein
VTVYADVSHSSSPTFHSTAPFNLILAESAEETGAGFLVARLSTDMSMRGQYH